MVITSLADFQKAIDHGPYAWPGGYPCYWLMSDGAAIAFDVLAGIERARAVHAIDTMDSSGWRPFALDINWDDESLVCARTGRPIECAYPPN